MSESTLKVEDVKRAVAELKAIRDRISALVADLEAKLEGSLTQGQIMKQLTERFVELWGRRYGRAYIHGGAKDATALKRLLKSLEPKEIERRMVFYFANDDAFFTKAAHSLTMFASTINQHVGATEQRGLEMPGVAVDCHHRPQCRSNVEHTRRVQQEIRA
jgi:hypothetical protein